MQQICIVIPTFYPATIYGGPIFTSYYTCKELFNIGINFCVVSTNANGKKRLAVSKNLFTNDLGFPVKYYHDNVIGKFSWPLFCNIKSDILKSDIVHIQGIFSSPVPISLFWASKLDKRIILTPHGAISNWSLSTKKSLFKKLWLHFFLRSFVKKIHWHATSEFEKNDILTLFPNAKVTVVPNGIYLNNSVVGNSLSKSIYKKYTTTNNEFNPIIVSMGRLHVVKGFDILIHSFASIKKQYPAAALYIAGHDDGELLKLKKLVADSNLTDSVFFTGNLEAQDKIDFLVAADLFVLPSHTENFGIVYAEALAAGTPIVASTNTPWAEVEAAGCGRWVPNTVEDTANAMLDLLSRDREQLRQNALQYVQKFDWKNIALQFKELYERVLAKQTNH